MPLGLSHQWGVFNWARGVGAEVFGVAGEAQSGLFDGVGGESVGCVGVGNSSIRNVVLMY
ncbi:MAG: hypothetical protein AB3A66_29765 (plasmid) [Nodularia sp. CChRGM 3473]